MKHKKTFVIKVLLLIVFSVPIVSFSQTRDLKLSGVVKDNLGEPLIGATVSIRNTSLGTITDIDGK